MISIRQGVFETNSSSQHCLSVNAGMRDTKEFPQLIDGNVYIPFGNPDETKNFVQLVQYIVCMMLDEKSVETLMTLPEDERKQFYQVVQLAYRMAGLGEVDEVVITPPERCKHGGIHIEEDGDVALWGGERAYMSTLSTGLSTVLDELSHPVRRNNTAMSLVARHAKDVDPNVAYAAAALALNTSGHFIEI